MSLTGLDTPEVNEAYQSAIAEAGGWFLLKYTSRENVELLGKGRAGVHEARAALAKYEEPSPLYGLLIYRRRKVLIKYIPEGTSRVLQARTAVHFQDILERYSPYETLLEITTADSLNDTSLAASFPLHTASPATSSNRLHEISEDAEDPGHAVRPSLKQEYASTGSVFGTQRYKSERRVEQLMSGERTRRSTPSIRVSDEQTPQADGAVATKKPSLSQFLVRDESGQRSITSLSTHPSVGSVGEYASSDDSSRTAETTVTEHEPRHMSGPPKSEEARPLPPIVKNTLQTAPQTSSATTRSQTSSERPSSRDQQSTTSGAAQPADDDPYDLKKYDHLLKPKVKLGPRPVTASERRTTMAGTAPIPSNFRSAQKKQESMKAKQPEQPKMTQTQHYAMQNLPAPPPIPNLPEYNPRPVSRGSIKSLPSHKSGGMTPDKLRLMKAVELRKKQLRKSNPQPSTFVLPQEEDVASMPAAPAQLKAPETYQPTGKAAAVEDVIAQSKKPDSGISMGYDPGQHQKEAKAEPEQKEEVRPGTPPSAEAASSAVEGNGEGSEEQAVLLQSLAPITVAPQSNAQDESSQPSDKADDEQDPEAPVEKTVQPMLSAFTSDDQPAEARSTEAARAVPLETPGGGNAEPTFSLDMLGSYADSRPNFSIQHDSVTPDGVRQERSETAEVPQITVAPGTRPHTPEPEHENSADKASHGIGASSPVSPMKESDAAEPEEPVSPKRAGDLARRRRGIVEPLQLDSLGDGDIALDEDLMDELQSATIVDATPMHFSRSPRAMNFAGRRPSDNADSVKSISIRRSSSHLLEAYEADSNRGSYARTSREAARKSSTSPPLEQTEARPVLSRKVSSGIDKRVQALAEATQREVSPNSTRSPTPEQPQAPAWRERKSSVRSPPRSRTSSMQRIARSSRPMSGYALSRESSNEYSSPAAVPAAAPVWSMQQDSSGNNRNSVSVSARIVRRPEPTKNNEEEVADAPLQRSEIVVNHRRASQQQLNKALPPLNTGSASAQPSPDATSSPWATVTNMPQPAGAPDYRTLHSAHNRKSFGKKRSSMNAFTSAMSPATPSADDFPPPPAQYQQPPQPASRASTVPSTASSDGGETPRDGSRTSRFFKRMSNFGGKDKRRSGAQVLGGFAPSPAEVQREPSRDRTDAPPAVVVGDLNVQFPDSLLWKRRLVEIDNSGYLNFSTSPTLNNKTITNASSGLPQKRFHLSELRQPYIPDLDVQELPNSVMIDFIDGAGSMQVACEDAMTQRQVLHLIKGYWRSWAGLQS